MIKACISILALFLAVISAQAQGRVVFMNICPGTDAPVYDSDGITLLAGSRYQAQLLYGTDPGNLTPVSSSAPFMDDFAAGYFGGDSVALPGIAGGANVYLQVRVWDTQTGLTYDAAAASGQNRICSSGIIQVTAGSPPPGIPTSLTGLQPFGFTSPPVIVSQPVNLIGDLLGDVSFSVGVTGTRPLTYQWCKNGANMAGANDSDLALSFLSYDDAAAYSLVVSNVYGCVTSTPAQLSIVDTVAPGLAITSHTDLQLVSPNSFTLSGLASDAGLGDNGIAAVTVNGLPTTGGTASGSGTAHWSYSGNLSTGTNTFVVLARDTLGNTATTTIRVVVDNSRPTIIITSPATSLRCSNSVYSVSGRASDDKSVAAVRYQINQGDWAFANGTTNWSANLHLSAGTNIVRAFAVDNVGNVSTTNSVSLTYVVVAPLTVQTNGKGSVSPNYNGAMLEVGRSYTMTATAQAGFTFANWTGSLENSKSALTFVMASNLTLTANFTDSQKPVIIVDSPKPSQRWSNEVFNITGRASDNVGVASIWYQVNGGDLMTADGTTNWSAMIELNAGTNTLKVFATDTAGNNSATNVISLDYVVLSSMTVSTNGRGTLSPNYNGASLEVGRNYSMTATAAPGFTFTNWTGSLSNNKAALTFMMQSNMTLTANFVDSQKPVLSVTAPSASQRWTNQSFTISGKASDNVGVAAIWYQVNGGDLLTATGTTNWSAEIQLNAGTNTLKVFATDAAGNHSTTNTASLDFVVLSPMTVSTNGRGTVSPNYNGASLEVGRNYSMTATATPGFTFTNWTGSLSNNKAALTFMMQSNMTLTANFVDSQKPTLGVATPSAFQRWTNQSFTMSGKATDNVGVAGVWYQFNGADWTLADGTTNWSAQLALHTGTNTVKVFSADAAGNKSTTNSASIFFVVTSPLTLVTNGLGKITQNFTGSLLEIGRAYTVTAVPGIGQVFSNWTGGLVLTNNPLTFIMQTNLVLEANFVTNPFTATKGVYNGLFYETNGVQNYSAGYFTLTLSENGSYTANVKLAGSVLAWVGQFDVAGNSYKTVPRAGTNALQVALSLDLNPGVNRLTGTLATSNWVAELTADRSTFNALTNPAVQAGKYTIAIPGTPGDPTLPAGHGYGALTITAAGAITFSGTLADGTAVNQTATLSKDGYWPLYYSAYAGKGCLLGWINVTNTDANDLGGALNWIQPPQTISHAVTPGFNVQAFAEGSRYITPAVTNRVLSFTNGIVDFAGGNLGAEFANSVQFNANNLVANTSSNKLTLTVTAATGIFTGSVLEPVSGKTWQFKGAFLQKQNEGLGFLTGTNASSSVLIESQ